jgi:phosphatidylserine/phosphatidylglycerophosphate/cardiolipin synthase-like enzyme
MLLFAVSSAALGEADVCFTPGQDCRKRLAELIGEARTEVLVQAYSLTSREVVEALVAAGRRGAVVRVMLDEAKSHQRAEGRAAVELVANGAEVLVDAAHAIAHNKVAVLDGRRVVTGSYNFSAAAQERNAENLLVIDDEQLVRRYAENWHRHAAHSHPFAGPQSAESR